MPEPNFDCGVDIKENMLCRNQKFGIKYKLNILFTRRRRGDLSPYLPVDTHVFEGKCFQRSVHFMKRKCISVVIQYGHSTLHGFWILFLDPSKTF